MDDQLKLQILEAVESHEIAAGDFRDEDIQYLSDSGYLVPGIGSFGVVTVGTYDRVNPKMQVLPMGLTPKGQRTLGKLRAVYGNRRL